MLLSDLGELEFLRRLRRDLPALAPAVDDAAVLPGISRPVVTTDSFIEGRHFHRWWCDPEVLGRRLLEATLSDLAAMGCSRPGWVLCALGCPGDTDYDWLRGFYAGMLSREDSVLAGGETVESPVLSITLTAIGEAGVGGRLLSRSGLAPGDDLWVTGPVGRALDAPALLAGCGGLSGLGLDPPGKVGEAVLEQLRAFLRPAAAFRHAGILVERGVGCAIDVSDGLVSEAAHLAECSRVDVDILLDEVPFFESVAGRPLEAACAGEDFVLLFGAGRGGDFATSAARAWAWPPRGRADCA